MILSRMAKEKAFPFELKTPNAETRAAIQESRAIMKAGHAWFNDGSTKKPVSIKQASRSRGARARSACLPGVDRHPAYRIAHDLSVGVRHLCVMVMVVVRGHRHCLRFQMAYRSHLQSLEGQAQSRA